MHPAGIKVYDGDGWFITVRLSDICGSEIIEREDEETETVRRGIFIPFREGGLTVTSRKNVLAVFKARLAQVPSLKYTHLLTQIVDRNVIEARKAFGYKPGFVGHMRKSDNKKTKNTQK